MCIRDSIFRMPTITDAWNCFCGIFTNKGSLYLPQIDELMFLVIVAIVPIIKDILIEFEPDVIKKFFANVFLRRTYYVLIALALVIFGVFNADSFIYLQF